MIQIGELRLEERGRIDGGHHGDVFRMRDLQLNADFAVKKIPLAQFHDSNEWFDEAHLLYQSRHPNVVQVIHATASNQHVLIAMELCERGPLSSLTKKGPLLLSDVVRYGLQFLTGLHHVHTKGLVHSDIKPSNILLDRFNRARLSDFGLARQLDPDGLVMHTRFYHLHRPPEAITGTVISQKADIYQAGVTLYRLCNGDRTIRKQMNVLAHSLLENPLRDAVLRGEFPDRKRYYPHVPKRLRNIIKKALHIDPDRRWSSVLEMMNAIARLDKFNDWKMGPAPATGGYVWQLQADTHVKHISLVNNAQTSRHDVLGKKVFPNRERQQRKWSRPGLTRDEAFDFLTELLQNKQLLS